MPSTGTPRSRMAGSQCGAPGSNTLRGPPEKMIPFGFSSATRAAGRSCRTTWQKTFCSRTRRAMSWPYCAPKSRIRTSSCSGGAWVGVMTAILKKFRGLTRLESPPGQVLHQPGEEAQGVEVLPGPEHHGVRRLGEVVGVKGAEVFAPAGRGQRHHAVVGPLGGGDDVPGPAQHRAHPGPGHLRPVGKVFNPRRVR